MHPHTTPPQSARNRTLSGIATSIALLLVLTTSAAAQNGRHSQPTFKTLHPAQLSPQLSPLEAADSGPAASLTMAVIHADELGEAIRTWGQLRAAAEVAIAAAVRWDELRVRNLYPSSVNRSTHPVPRRSSNGKSFSPKDSSTASGTRARRHHHSRRVRASQIFEGAVTTGASFPGAIGQYFVELLVGTPQQSFFFIIDTGSDLVWIPCSLCQSCHSKQPNTNVLSALRRPIFHPEASSTFVPIACSSEECTLIPPPPGDTCNPSSPTSCTYTYAYSDLSRTTGVFAYDAIAMKPTARFPRSRRLHSVAFGCGTNNTGPSITGQGGVLGLGRGPISFSTQLGAFYGNKFSYCFPPFFHKKQRGLLVFGDGRRSMKLAEVLRFTPLLQTANEDTFYHLKVEAIKVNERALHIKPSLLRMDSFGNGGFIIDSGTTLTFFTKPLFRAVYMEFKHNVVYPRAPPTAGLRLCYNVSGVSKPRFPRIAIVFAGGAVFRPPPRNYFLSPLNDVRCLGFLSNEGASVLGNLMQQNYYVEYDRHENRLGFAKAHCSAND